MEQNTTIKLNLSEGDITIEAAGTGWDAMALSLADYAVRQARMLRRTATNYEALALRIAGYQVLRDKQSEYEHNGGEHDNPDSYQRKSCPLCREQEDSGVIG